MPVLKHALSRLLYVYLIWLKTINFSTSSRQSPTTTAAASSPSISSGGRSCGNVFYVTGRLFCSVGIERDPRSLSTDFALSRLATAFISAFWPHDGDLRIRGCPRM